MMNNTAVFHTYARYYDLLNQDKDYVAEVEYIKALLTAHGVQSGDILEFGSGTGKHGVSLAQKGFNVHGIEQSHEMVEHSKKTKGFTCEQGDITTISLKATFDVVLSLFHVMSYQTSNAQLKAVFANAVGHLKPGGLFVFDFWYAPAVLNLRPSVRVKRIEDHGVEVVRVAEPELFQNESRVDVNYTFYACDHSLQTMTSFKETHSMRYISLQEIDLLAEFYGFERIAAEEFLSGNAPSETTWGVCVVLKKV